MYHSLIKIGFGIDPKLHQKMAKSFDCLCTYIYYAIVMYVQRLSLLSFSPDFHRSQMSDKKSFWCFADCTPISTDMPFFKLFCKKKSYISVAHLYSSAFSVSSKLFFKCESYIKYSLMIFISSSTFFKSSPLIILHIFLNDLIILL